MVKEENFEKNCLDFLLPLGQFFQLSLKTCYMNLLQRIEYWGDRHHPKWMDIVRIVLGLFLVYKGVQFLENMSSMMNLMSNQVPFSGFMIVLLSHYIAFAHIAGGILLALGVLTRFACLIQIPVLLGAVFFINSSSSLLQPFSELLISIVVLMLLIYFLVVGNGSWSVGLLMNEEKKA